MQPWQIARPYARALFSLAKSTDKIDAYSQILADLRLIVIDPNMVGFLKNPTGLDQQRLDIIQELLGDPEPSIISFLREIGLNKRWSYLESIIELFEGLKKSYQNTEMVTLVTAIPCEHNLVTLKIQKMLEKKLEREVAFRFVVDPSILGGAIIKIGDSLFDGSVRAKLANLNKALEI